MSRKSGVAFVLAAASSAVLAGCVVDRVDFSNRAFRPVPFVAVRGDAGVLVDGRRELAGQVENDAGFVANPEADKLPIPNFVAGGRGELIAFTMNKRPVHVAPSWTSGGDVIAVDFPERIVLPIRVWIVAGDFGAQADRAREAVLRTNSIWRSERIGLAIGEIEIVDATHVTNVGQVTAFPNGDMGDAVGWSRLRQIVGYRPSRLNIYWVDTVNTFETAGWSNFDSMIVMGSRSGDDLLSHEIGHALSLRHVDFDLPAALLGNFDDTNIMDSGSDTRAFITEGQILRAHFDQNSILRSLYPETTPVLPRRTCAGAVANEFCPALDRRLWPDGAFPANN